MSTNNKQPGVIHANVPLQETSQDIWSDKYRLRDQQGRPIDPDVDASYERTANALSQSEKPQYRKQMAKKFLEAMREYGTTPAGRIMSNAGAELYKPAVSLINCTVSDTIHDSMDGILEKVKEAGMTLKAGCGIGYEFSTLRPDGAYVAGAGASTSGPLSFMDIFDKMCKTVSSAGGRRGAQMGTFDVTHPDAPKFVVAKREDGRLRQFNLSLLITDEFITAVRANAMWQPLWNGLPYGDSYPARQLWDSIMESNYNFAEPGFLLIDRINMMNNLWFVEHLRATNPCGEQPLPKYGSCLLGSQNLTKFIIAPFTPQARFDFDKFYEVSRTFARMLDNVVEMNGLPLAQQRHEIEHKRRHGMGYLGLGSALAMLGDSYGSSDSIAFTDEVSKLLAFANFEEGAALAKEKGEAPVLKAKYSRADIAEHLKYNKNHVSGTRKVFTGRELFLQSHYFDAWREDSDGRIILKMMEKNGSRYSHATSIAPTGTIALTFGNNASNGIEPSFSHFYTRNVIREGRNAKEAIPVYSYEYLAYRHFVDPDCQPMMMPAAEREACVSAGMDVAEESRKRHYLPINFVATDDLTPKQHVDIQAAAQRWVDSSISKTINVPTNISRAEFDDIYLYAYDKGLKGCTTFRFNPEAFQGVLVKAEDLQATRYVFTLADGTSIEVAGDEQVEYDGQVHSAANLFDAIKEGYYGKF